MKSTNTAIALAACVLLTACSPPEPTAAWRHNLERYVNHHGAGNPAALTALHGHDTRHTFSSLGPERGLVGPTRTDTHGILVGHHRIGDELWFVYLLGIVEDQGGVVDVNFDRPVVREIRPVAFRRATDGFHWATGKADNAATERYLAHQRQRWQRSHPDRDPEDMPHTRFPRPYDRFELEDNGHRVTIRHADTGARWSLRLRDREPPVRAVEADDAAAGDDHGG
ncbi:MAG: hypothetical protein ACODAQ_10965 [Phycisphaeraceae bacterium]